VGTPINAPGFGTASWHFGGILGMFLRKLRGSLTHPLHARYQWPEAELLAARDFEAVAAGSGLKGQPGRT